MVLRICCCKLLYSLIAQQYYIKLKIQWLIVDWVLCTSWLFAKRQLTRERQ